MNLKDVLAAKGPRVVCVSAKSSVADAIRTMHAQKVGAVLVPEAEGCPVGILTERDVVRLFAEGDHDFDQLPVEARMTCSLVVGRLSTSVDEALALMTERRFRHLPVVEDGKLLGLVSIGDLVKSSSKKRRRRRRRCAATSARRNPRGGTRCNSEPCAASSRARPSSRFPLRRALPKPRA